MTGRAEATRIEFLRQAHEAGELPALVNGILLAEGRDGIPDELIDVLARLRAVRTPALSPREIEVMELLVRGASHRQISQVLGISLSTVKTHVARCHHKLDVTGLRLSLKERWLVAVRRYRAQHPEGVTPVEP